MHENKPTIEELQHKIAELQKENKELKEKISSLEEFENNIYFSFFNSLKDFLWILDENANIIFTNNYALERLHYTKDELYQKNVLVVHPKEREDEVLQTVSDMISGKIDFCSIPIITKEGRYIPVETRVFRGVWNRKNVIFGISKDISELKLSEEKFSKAFDLISNAIAISELESGIYLDVNQKFLNIFELKKEEVIGKSSIDLGLFDAKTRKRVLNDFEKNGYLENYEIELNYKGKKIYALFSATKFFLQDKQCLMTTFQDITDLKLTQIELQKAKEKAEESDQLKTAFLQNISHEIRTPLNAIFGFSQLLKDNNLSNQEKNEFISLIQNSCSQLLSIVTDIITISSLDTKQEKIRISKVSINKLIDELLDMFQIQAKNKNITFSTKFKLNFKQSEIYTDRTKITQILNNLLSNALKFTEKGFIECGYTLVKSNYTSTPQYEMQFYVKDTGIGIKPELHEKIFERFLQVDQSTTKLYGGTGLGLAITKGFVELLGGRIWVESQVGKGSTFYFTIPFNPVNEISNLDIEDIKKDKPMILVVDDDDTSYLFIEVALKNLDYKLIRAENGQEAIDIVKTTPSISLILMDIRMPILEGYTATKIIKELRPELPIIAQTAYALESDIEKYSDIFDEYLTKPLRRNVLIEKIMKYIPNS